MNYWLMKTEPDVFSIQDLKESPKAQTDWEGVRNYQARNFMRDEMKLGDKVFIYHSSCKNIGIVGLAKVVKESHPDISCLDKNSPYFDKISTKEKPRWHLVTLEWRETFKSTITLAQLKKSKELEEMYLVKKGSRLSVQPVKKGEFDFIYELSKTQVD